MRFEDRKITLKDGRTCVLTPNSPEYAEQMLEYLKVTSGETDFLLRNPDEVKYTLEEEKEILQSLLDNPYVIMMAAIVDGKVSGIGDKRKIQHRCSMAIALYQEYCNLGIGKAMIGYMSELAKQTGWTQMDLEVVAENEKAQRLYEKCGFIATGRRHNALRSDDGTCHDEILMYKDL